MRTPREVERQLEVVEKAIKGWPSCIYSSDELDWAHATGMQQVLSWMLNKNTASPRACLPKRKRGHK